MERQNLESHIANDCPLTIVDCDFKGVGCEVWVPRKNLPSHLTEGLVAHVSLQTKQLMNVTVENQQLKQEVMKLKDENEQLKHVVEKLTEDIGQYQIGIPLCPAELIMTNFEQHKKDGDKWHSPPFYTHPKGYKMCLRIYANGSGVGVGANMHVSLGLVFMKGEYDDQLKWPFQGKVTIQLLSQNGDERHWENTVPYDSSTDDKYCNRVKHGERAEASIGYPKFIPHSELKPMYLQSDCLKFCIAYES
jgi:ferredoxin-thioredoxin reductase catalytic subunit